MEKLNSPLSEEVCILVEEDFTEIVEEKQVEEIARRVLEAEGVGPPYEVSLFFTGSETVQRLNRDYRGLDESTDVLAFYMLSRQEPDSSFVLPPDGVTHLGEVVISCPQAAQQAKTQGHSLERELALLIIHGMLHLLGYDHEEPEEEKRMREKEQNLLQICLPAR